MTDIKIDQDAMQALVLKSILDSWDDETRDSLVTQALQSLLKVPEGQRWDNKSTVMDGILSRALTEAARTVVAEMVTNSPKYVKQIKDMVSPLVDSVLGDSSLYLDEAIGEALVKQIKEKRGY